MIDSAEILADGAAVRIHWQGGGHSRFHAVWLRDNALDGETRDPVSGQKWLTVQQIPADTRIADARAEDGGLAVRFLPEDKTVAFPAGWLREHVYDRAEERAPGWTGPAVACWDKASMNAPHAARFDAMRTDRATLADWLAAIERDGVATVDGMPVESGALLDLVALFGFVRESSYGRWFEVRAEVNAVNLAYTDLGLQAHTDLPYCDPAPTLQILACLESAAAGGESAVVDGFRAVEILCREDPDHFALLSSLPARFDYRGMSGVRLSAKRPMIELGPDGELCAVRFNNRSLAPLTDIPFARMADYYTAYRHLSEIIDRPELEVSFTLRPGQAFMVDNTRVLHARKPFTGGGERWLQGCYAEKDALLSTLAGLRQPATAAHAAE